MGTFPAALALLLASSPGDRVAVVAVSPDAPPAALQGALEDGLAAANVPLIRSVDAAPRIGSPEPSAGDPAARAAVLDLLDAASKAYYDDHYKQMSESLNRAAASKTIAGERVQIALWEVAFYLSIPDQDDALDQAKAALLLSPDLKVDLKVYPPGVQDTVEKARKTLTQTAVRVTGLPASAEIRVDDRVVPAAFAVPPGAHELAVLVPGCRRLVLPLTVGAQPVTVAPHPTIALDASRAAAFAADVAKGEAPAGLDDLAAKSGASVLVLAAVQGNVARAVVWWRADGRRVATAPRAADAAGFAALAGVVAREIGSGAPSRRDRAIDATIGAAALLSIRSTSVSAGENRWSTALAGTGPRVVASAVRGPWSAAAHADLVDYDLSSFRASGTSEASTTGGRALALGFAAGWDLRLGAPGEQQTSGIGLRAGVEWERYDVTDAGGLHLLVGEERISPRLALRFGTATALLRRGEGRLGAELVLEPAARSTSSGDAWGRSASGTALGAAIDASWQTPRRWRMGLALSGEMRDDRWSGPVATPLDPPASDLRVRRQVDAIVFRAGRAF